MEVLFVETGLDRVGPVQSAEVGSELEVSGRSTRVTINRVIAEVSMRSGPSKNKDLSVDQSGRDKASIVEQGIRKQFSNLDNTLHGNKKRKGGTPQWLYHNERTRFWLKQNRSTA